MLHIYNSSAARAKAALRAIAQVICTRKVCLRHCACLLYTSPDLVLAVALGHLGAGLHRAGVLAQTHGAALGDIAVSYTHLNDSHWRFTDKVVSNLVALVKYLMAEYGIDAAHVIRHYDVNGKPCPGIIGRCV